MRKIQRHAWTLATVAEVEKTAPSKKKTPHCNEA
jgi:hypothetical protein